MKRNTTPARLWLDPASEAALDGLKALVGGNVSRSTLARYAIRRVFVEAQGGDLNALRAGVFAALMEPGRGTEKGA